MRITLFLLTSFLTGNLFAQDFAEPYVLFNDPDVTLTMSVSSADFDGDGLKDVLMTSAQMNVFYNKNLGNGDFGDPVIIFDEEVFGQQAEPLDVDMDGDIDVIAAVNFDNKVIWVENDGQGNFTNHFEIGADMDDMDDMLLSDLDNDGLKDVVVSTYKFSGSLGQIFWYKNLGNGEFSELNLITNSISDTRTLTVEDFNGDGRKDVLIGTSLEPNLGWIPNLGDGNFGDAVIIDADRYVSASFSSDLDNDGDMDLIISSSFDTYMYLNDGNGNFTEHGQVFEFQSTWAVTSADVDSDGDQDIIIGDSVGDELDIFINNNGSYNTSFSFSNINGFINGIRVADLDGDGDLDILTSSSENEVLYYENLVDLPVYTKDLNVDNLTIYPNPNRGNFTISLDTDDIEDVQIFDVNGRAVAFEYDSKAGDIALRGRFTKGHYFIMAYSKDRLLKKTGRFYIGY